MLPAVAGAVAMLVVTRRGAYLSPDALSYVGTARELVDGNGYRAPPGSPPLGNFPPLYPLVLAAVGYLGLDPLTVARFLNPLLLGATVLVAGLLLHRLTGSLPLAVAGQLLLVSGVDLLAYHSSALSEPLFLLLTVLALAAGSISWVTAMAGPPSWRLQRPSKPDYSDQVLQFSARDANLELAGAPRGLSPGAARRRERPGRGTGGR